jgi:hypothetical protein
MSIGRYFKINISDKIPIGNQLSFEFGGRKNLDEMIDIALAVATNTPPCLTFKG